MRSARRHVLITALALSMWLVSARSVRADPASMPATASAPVAHGPSAPSEDRTARSRSPEQNVGEVLRGVTSPPARAIVTPPPDDALSAKARAGHPVDPLVARGAYLARVGDCIACHTARQGAPYAGGLAIDSPLGTIYSTNITPDRQTGIGTWTFDDFANLMRRGETKAGYVVYPAMPFPSYARVTDDDLRALYAYLMKGVAPVSQPNRRNGIPWPLSMRWPLKIWRVLFAPSPQPFQPATGMSAEVARGAYLVQGLGHCGSCHTPRALTLQEKALTEQDGSVYLSGGGAVDAWIAPSLRSEHGGGLASWSEREIVEFLATGRTARTASFGAMNDVIIDSTQYMSLADLNAIAAYLKSLGPRQQDTPAYAYDIHVADRLFHGQPGDLGARVYLDRCAGCHRSNGTGYGKAFPALAGNPVLQTSNPTSAIHIVLAGSTQPGTATAPSSFTMAPYADLLDDNEIAAVVTFIQTSWGNRGGKASAAQVAKMRRSAEPVEAEGFRGPVQRELRHGGPGEGAQSKASGVAAGE